MNIRTDTKIYLHDQKISEQEYLENPFLQGGVAFGQWMASKFKDKSLLTNPYPTNTEEYLDWEIGFNDWCDGMDVVE